MEAILILFLMAVGLICIWKLLEPEKPIKDIIKEIAVALNPFTLTPTSKSQSVSAPVQRNQLYSEYKSDYEKFACIVLNYIQIIQSRYNLCCPADAEGIHCAEIAERVKNLNGITFQYEVPCKETLYEGGMKAATPSVDTDEIAEMLRRNLQDCMTGGYYFTGDINVWPVGKKYVRIEIQGVWRDTGFVGGN